MADQFHSAKYGNGELSIRAVLEDSVQLSPACQWGDAAFGPGLFEAFTFWDEEEEGGQPPMSDFNKLMEIAYACDNWTFIDSSEL